METMKVKYCKKCQTTKNVSEFYKKTSSPDGLQSSCKSCQNKANKLSKSKKLKIQVSNKKETKNGTPRGLHFKRLSNYHLIHGLEYKLEGKLKKHSYRNTVTYKCLTCGKEFTTDLDTAWSYRYNCEDCVCLIPGLPTDKLMRPSSFKPEVFEHIPQPMPQCANNKSKNKNQKECQCENHSCDEYHEISSEVNSELHKFNDSLTQDEILNKIEQIRSKLKKQKTIENVHVIVLQVPQQIPEQPKKKGFWNWIKSLFHK